ncbi:MAG: hypothetical protein WBL82_17575, partial [Terriglobales bacterium]
SGRSRALAEIQVTWVISTLIRRIEKYLSGPLNEHSEWTCCVSGRLLTPLAHLGRAYALSGNQKEARKIADPLKLSSRQHYVPAWDMAVLFAGMRDSDSAFRWLEKSFAKRESQMPFLKADYRGSVTGRPPL